MRRTCSATRICAIGLVLLIAAGAAARAESIDRFAEELTIQSGWAWTADPESQATKDSSRELEFAGILGIEREVLVDDIAHYSFDLRIGPGSYDKIRLHRVVAESAPYQPVPARKNIFLMHGDAVGFIKFLFGTVSATTEQSGAVYLARNGVDVWGMDQDWILVPSETTDFGFMADWGLQRQVDNLSIAVRLAREVRSLTGSGHGGINVLGYSSGGITAYALANQEAQRPPGQQDVGGLVAVDIHYKYAPGDEDGRAFTCAFAADALGLLDSGTYEDQTGVLFQTLAFLAASAPDDPSPVVPGLSNLQAMLFIASATYEAFPFNEWWHYMGGQFEEGLPTGLEYTTVGQAIDFLSVAAPFEPLRFLFDYTTIMCDESDTPFDDHLADIRVPVLYLGAAGGIGQTGVYTLSLLRRADVTVSIGQLRPDEERALDIGHIDIWTAAVARDVFWRPLLEWIEDHTPGH